MNLKNDETRSPSNTPKAGSNPTKKSDSLDHSETEKTSGEKPQSQIGNPSLSTHSALNSTLECLKRSCQKHEGRDPYAYEHSVAGEFIEKALQFKGSVSTPDWLAILGMGLQSNNVEIQNFAANELLETPYNPESSRLLQSVIPNSANPYLMESAMSYWGKAPNEVAGEISQFLVSRLKTGAVFEQLIIRDQIHKLFRDSTIQLYESNLRGLPEGHVHRSKILAAIDEYKKISGGG